MMMSLITSSPSTPRPKTRVMATLPVLLMLAGLSTVAMAQDALVDAGREVWKEGAGCFNCHGQFGEGGEGGHFPAGPSLRRSQLDMELIREIASCGLPGTQMPYNLEGAYAEHICYGIENGEPIEGVVPGARLSLEEMDALMAYIEADILGKRRVTKEECVAYYGDESEPVCASYR